MYSKLWSKLLQYIPLELQAKVFIGTRALSIIIKLVMADQLFKWWFISYLPTAPNMVLEVTEFLDMVYLWNYGISFGFFKDYYKYSNFTFIVINTFIVIYLCFSVIKQETILSFYGYSMIIGGAVGNLVDRFVRGAVFDFISFHYEDVFWFPAFNFADSFVFMGVATILYDYYKIAKTKKNIAQKNKNFYDEFEEQAESIRNREETLKINN